MSCTFWNMRRRKAALERMKKEALNNKVSAPVTGDTEKTPDKKTLAKKPASKASDKNDN